MTTPVRQAEKTKECPRCKNAASLCVPIRNVDERVALYTCAKCGYAFRANGGAFVENPDVLRNIFRSATLGHTTLAEAIAGEKINAETKALLLAIQTEYGLQMWFDGFKQGLVCGVTELEHNDGKV